jgi:hypothetical protein
VHHISQQQNVANVIVVKAILKIVERHFKKKGLRSIRIFSLSDTIFRYVASKTEAGDYTNYKVDNCSYQDCG